MAAQKDIRKMDPKTMVKFALRVLRATSPKAMVQRLWWRPQGELDEILTRLGSVGSKKKMKIIFEHKKDCLACAVGCVLLADGERAAALWDETSGGTQPSGFSDFTYSFLLGLSDAFESGRSPFTGRKAAIKYAEKVLKGISKHPVKKSSYVEDFLNEEW